MREELQILVVDDDAMMLRTLSDILEVRGHRVRIAASGSEALALLADEYFDAVVSDIRMPELDGVALFHALHADYPEVPVLLMTAYASDQLVQQGREAGVVEVLTKPLDIDLLLRFCDALHCQRSVVIIDDDPGFRRTLGEVLRQHGFAVTEFADASTLVEHTGARGQVVLLDLQLEGQDGLAALRELRVTHPRQPVVLVTGHPREMEAQIEAGLANHAHACLHKPLAIEELLRTLAEIRHRELGRELGAADQEQPATHV